MLHMDRVQSRKCSETELKRYWSGEVQDQDTTNLATGVSRLPVLGCGMASHPIFGSRDSPAILSDDL